MHKNCKKCKRSKRNSEEFQWTCKRNASEFQKKFTRKCCHCVQNKKWWKNGMPHEFLLKLCCCSFALFMQFLPHRIFLQNWFKPHQTAKTFITCLSFFLQPAPFFCTTLTSTESEFAKADSRIFWPSCSSKTKPNPCKPFKVLYKYATNKCDYTYNMLLCYYSFRPPHLQP